MYFTVFVLLIKPIAFTAFTLIFLIFVIIAVALSMLVALPHKTILDAQQFCLKNQKNQKTLKNRPPQVPIQKGSSLVRVVCSLFLNQF